MGCKPLRLSHSYPLSRLSGQKNVHGEIGHQQPAARLNQAFKKPARHFYTFNSHNPTLAFTRTFIESLSDCMGFLLDATWNLWNIKIVLNDQCSMWKDRSREVPLLPPNQAPCSFQGKHIKYVSFINLPKSILKLLLFPATCNFSHMKTLSGPCSFDGWIPYSPFQLTYPQFFCCWADQAPLFQIKTVSYFCSHV